ncbi:trimeric intracellular cation channel family protein [Algiphilus sp. W345]|uniref:Trimeric intracellular cation channel family protein n=1 Tax=Banduia mediterranea TaxID=3075609 RepID=A0ABU2WIL2_9GAMM|nr:trimeric intracellular cation channel family protein [Algiphilus sp. W345]MDT0497718.1 trimeric intracellular cation channel family protein [Algiphilus sp. W345]
MTLSQILDLIGVGVFAVSGALAAGRKSLDLMGVVVIAIAASIGGGTLRDLLLNRHPVFWIASPSYLIVIVVCALLTVAWTRWFRPPNQSLQYADALGLAFFTISGAQIAETLNFAPIIVIVMGTITGVVGGVLRDILCAEIPMILRRGNIYATAAIAGAAFYLAMNVVGLPRPLPSLLGMSMIAGLRLAAIRWNLQLPVFSLDRDNPPR